MILNNLASSTEKQQSTMGKIQVLDCTLRDGGYCNEWKFGQQNIEKIIESQTEAGIDIIECGFLKESIEYEMDKSLYHEPADIKRFLPQSRHGTRYVAMLNLGEYRIENLSEHNDLDIDGIRLAFHKKDIKEAIDTGKRIQEKGYLLFLQPMVSLSYTDEEFLALIRETNKIKPFAFYIVDSFGVMKRKDMIRLFYMVEHDLNKEIAIGFHSHNNMQLAYSNAQTLVDIRTKHSMIIDSSIYGMGRGAGNLNTELFVEYLNDNEGTDYKLRPLLAVIDEILDGFYQRNPWGYSLPNYLSAAHDTHPNYAGYLNDKHTLTVQDMNNIFDMMDDEKRVYFDRDYIEDLYFRYLSNGQVQDARRDELEQLISGKKVLLVAPGKSSLEEKDRIAEFAGKVDVMTVGVNHEYPYAWNDYIFVSNLRRFKELDKQKRLKCIVTSNISSDMVYLQTDYKTLLNSYEMVQDNAGLMAIKFFHLCGAKTIYLAGMDGYSHDTESNFGDTRMAFVTRNVVLDEMNVGISKVLGELSCDIDIRFLTAERYVRIGE